MIGNLWQRKKLRPLAYLIPALVLGILILFELTDIPVPILTRDERPVDHEHLHEGEFFLTESTVGNQVGTLVPYFELGLADGSTVDLTDMLESGKPTFLYFWSTT